jgi:hypothetical protein
MDNPIKNKNVETYVGDMTKALEGNKDGLIKKIIHEQEEYEEEKKNISPESKKNKFFVIGSVLLLAVAIFVLTSFVSFKKQAETVPVSSQFQSLISIDKTEFKEVEGFSRDEIVNSVFNLAQTIKVKEGGIAGVYLTENKKIVGLRRFLTLVKGNLLPGSEVLVSDNFMFGIENIGITEGRPTGGNLFMLLKARSFADIFPPMHAWEGQMLSDLSGFFGIKLNADNKYLLSKSFQDHVVNNKNARVLSDEAGNVVLLYIFADNNSVIITNNEGVIGEVITRLSSDKTKN